MANNTPAVVDQDTFTWGTFSAEVLSRCPIDASRLGTQDFLPRLIRDAVLDLQRYIPAFTTRHETIYYAADFTQDGSASVGAMPPSSKINDAWMYNTAEQERFEVVSWPWERRFELANREVPDLLNSSYVVNTAASLAASEIVNRLLNFYGPRKHCGLFAIDPQAQTFYLYPSMPSSWVFSMFWTGTKLNFRTEESVPFCERAAIAVSYYVRAHMRRDYERNQADYEAYMKDYIAARTNLYLDYKSKGDLNKYV